MKHFNLILVCIMFLCGTCTVVWAQGHRHSVRTDSTEQAIASETGESYDLGNVGWIDDDLGEYIGKTVAEAMADSFDHEREGWVLSAADRYGAWGIFIAIIVVTGIFLGPVIVIALILLFIYKRKKNRDAVVIEALRNGRDIPYGYGTTTRHSDSATSSQQRADSRSAAPACETPRVEQYYGRFSDQPIMQQGIKKIAIGLGLYVMSKCMYFDLLGGIGWFIVIYGIGQILIAYLSADKTIKETPAQASKYTRDEPKAEPATDGNEPKADATPSTETTTTEATATENEKPE